MALMSIGKGRANDKLRAFEQEPKGILHQQNKAAA